MTLPEMSWELGVRPGPSPPATNLFFLKNKFTPLTPNFLI